MKKTRILASLLCIMMIVCALPVMQASAAVGDLDSSVAAAMGVNSAINVYEQVIDANYASSDVSSTSTISNYTQNGLQIGTSTGPQSWSLAPSNDFWTNANAVVVKMKLGQDANDRITIRTEAGTRKNATRDDGTAQSIGKVILAGGVVYAGSNSYPGVMGEANFKLGFDWFELMIVHNTESFDVWVKNNPADTTACSTTGGQWAKLTFGGDLLYEQGHAGVGTSKYDHFGIVQDVSTNEVTYGSNENPAYLKSVSVYHEDTAIRTIDGALATHMNTLTDNGYSAVNATATTNAWNFANSTMTSYTRSGYNSISSPEGAVFTNEGLDLSKTNGTDPWRFSAVSGWGPQYLENATGGYRALYVKVKGDVTISTYMPYNKALNNLRSVPGKKLSESNAKAMDGTTAGWGTRGYFNKDLTVDSEWVEYLLFPRNSNAVYVWAKSATQTGGAWIQVGENQRYCWDGKNDTTDAEIKNTGVSFFGTGVVAEWKTVDFNTKYMTTVATNTEATPATATTLWFNEEFESTPAYDNKSFGDAMNFETAGVLSAPVKYGNEDAGIAATDGGANFYNIGIPVGGYADIRMKSNGVKGMTISDGIYEFSGTWNCDYSGMKVGTGAFAKGGNYISDSDVNYRTWRFVRTEAGYNIFSKTDADTGWRIIATGVNEESTNSARIRLAFNGNADGKNDGNGMVDYIKIYGPAPTGVLTLTDGYGTKVIADGGTLSYPASLRAIVTEDAGKLLVVSYKGDDMAKAQIVNVADMVNDSILVDARATGATKIKVFLWDNFSGLNRKTPAMTFGL